MKRLFVFLLVYSASFADAQIVNIPDPAFKQLLLNYTPAIDLNGDAQIEISEALAITALTITTGMSTDITGIQAFSNLTSLQISAFSITNFNLSGITQLITLNISSTISPQSINIAGCYNLTDLKIFVLTASNPLLSDLVFDSLPKLKSLQADFLYLANLDLRSCDSLSTLDLGGFSKIDILDISGLTLIDSIYTFGTIGILIAKNCTALKIISSGDGNPGAINDVLDVTGCTNLEEIYSGEFGPVTLDLSSCPHMRKLKVVNGSIRLQYLNLKNGSELEQLEFAGQYDNSSSLNVCVDDFEANTVTAQLIFNPGTIINISPYCSFFPAGSYNTIKGRITADFNNNGCDVNDPGMPLIPIRITDTSGGNLIRYTTSTGLYAHYPYKGLFTLQPYLAYPYFAINPVTATISFDTANSLVNTTDFCISPMGIHNDVEVTFLPTWEVPRPGFEAVYSLIYKNKGNTILSGGLQLNFDNNKINYLSSSEIPASQSPGQLTWNYNNLPPFQSKNISITFSLLSPPVNNIGDTLYYFASINPVLGDETPEDNSFILPQRVVGSYDPNDKECLEGKSIVYDDVDKSMHYVIRFQNTGTDTAFNVVVADSLSDKFDWNSVEIISSSHACDIQQKNGRLEFFFQNIKLPYSAINEPSSHGYVAFSIKPKSTVTIGDSLNNRAAIYFDFNLPVITNTALTIVSSPSTVPVKLEYFSVIKKDATNLLTWKAPSTTGSTIFNIERSANGIHFNNIGNITATAERSQVPFNFTDAIPLAGKNYYRLKITNADGVSFYSKILVIGNNKSGLEITAITSNRNNTILYLDASKDQTVQMRIIAADGKIVYSQSKIIATGSSQVNLQIRNISSGVYTLVVYTNDGEVLTRRFVK